MAALPTMTRTPADLPMREVGVDELFFSTTDDKGVITSANEVFVRLAAYPREKLIGAPHNIIRHPDMPGGAFRLMWDALEKNEPFIGYVRNKAGDDHTYDVLATVTPLPRGGYLSVRTTPMTEATETVSKAYFEANDLEKWVIGEGTNRREAAEKGAEKLKEIVGSYKELMWQILPAEVAAREAASTYEVSVDPDDELAVAVNDVLHALDQFMAQQDEIQNTVDKIRSASTRLGKHTEQTAKMSEVITKHDSDDPAATLLLAPLRSWTTMHSIVDEHVADLSKLLDKLSENAAYTRFMIALSRLHATMVTYFLSAEEKDATESVEMLTEALTAGARALDRTVFEHRSSARRVAGKVRSVTSLMEIPRQLIMDWSEATVVGESGSEIVDQVNSAIEGTNASIAELEDLSSVIAAESTPALDELREAVSRVAHALR